jgi:hypothetical protein
MDGLASGTTTVNGRDARGRFSRQNVEHRARRDRIAARLQQLCALYDTSPAYMQLLSVVAGFLDQAERGRSAVARTRASNSAMRLLAQVPRKPEPPLPATLKEALAR